MLKLPRPMPLPRAEDMAKCTTIVEIKDKKSRKGNITMDKKEQAEYLKNELRSYKTLKKWIESNSSIYDDQIKFCDRKIVEYDVILSSGNAKGIDFSYIPTTAVSEPILCWLAEQEKYQQRKQELLKLRSLEVNGFKARVKYIEECLDRLDDWERDFVVRYYSMSNEVSELSLKYHRSEAQLYRDKENLIRKMIL